MAAVLAVATLGSSCQCQSWGCQASCPCACTCPCEDQSLCNALDTPGTRSQEVFVFHASLYNGSSRPAIENFGHYPFAQISTVAVYTGTGNNTAIDTPLLLCTAHSHGTRVVGGVGGQWGTAPFQDDIMTNATTRDAAANQYVQEAVGWGYDGLNLNVEFGAPPFCNTLLATNHTSPAPPRPLPSV